MIGDLDEVRDAMLNLYRYVHSVRDQFYVHPGDSRLLIYRNDSETTLRASDAVHGESVMLKPLRRALDQFASMDTILVDPLEQLAAYQVAKVAWGLYPTGWYYTSRQMERERRSPTKPAPRAPRSERTRIVPHESWNQGWAGWKPKKSKPLPDREIRRTMEEWHPVANAAPARKPYEKSRMLWSADDFVRAFNNITPGTRPPLPPLPNLDEIEAREPRFEPEWPDVDAESWRALLPVAWQFGRSGKWGRNGDANGWQYRERSPNRIGEGRYLRGGPRARTSREIVCVGCGETRRVVCRRSDSPRFCTQACYLKNQGKRRARARVELGAIP